MAEDSSIPKQSTFILRSWWDASERRWRFLLESTHQRWGFASLAELIDFLNATFPDHAISDKSLDEE